MAKKIVLKVAVHGDKIKQKAMKVASGISGVDSVAMEMEEKKLTIVGEIDAVMAVKKLRKLCRTDIVSVGSTKEEEAQKKEEADSYSCYPHYYPPTPGLYCCYYHNY
ncbi:heavy metal-associated isoprenylated plant protein 12-like [Neltuma alba]|uniref:heavy metal-associated isoprenylated plant protein 12-like n=1 Tax=Neltuma alba TaxID=207710 RepID=UPI0010A57D87|nr:heavy metal-associated isoprenylated plant protein 12-like [Prosopis alba]